jgi:gamma-glutamyltranspeptidase/glutathione hydrolase
MAPTLVFDDNGLELAIGAAGATRLRTALATVLAAILDEGLDAETAVGLPRVHPTLELVDAEPASTTRRSRRSKRAGRTVRRWIASTTYFGGGAASRASACRSGR